MSDFNKNFQVELSYLKGEEGSADQKPVKESYIFKAVNYTDAETKLYQFAERNGIREFTHKITAVKINEIIDPNNGEDFWLSKTSYIIDLPSGKEKVIKETQLVNAKDFQTAADKVKTYFKTVANTVHTRLIGLQESTILEVVN